MYLPVRIRDKPCNFTIYRAVMDSCLAFALSNERLVKVTDNKNRSIDSEIENISNQHLGLIRLSKAMTSPAPEELQTMGRNT